MIVKEAKLLKSRMLRWGAGAVLSIVILTYLIVYVSTDRAWSLLSTISLLYAALALISYLISNAVKALRFNYLIASCNPSFVKMFYLNSQYNFYTAMIAGIGELSYPLMLKKMFGVPSGVGVSSVVLTRIYDLLFLSMVFVFAISSFLTGHMMKVALLTTISISVLMLVLAYFSDIFAKYLEGIFSLLFVKTGWSFTGRIARTLCDLSVELRQTKKLEIHMHLFLYTVLAWIFVFIVFYLLFMAFGVQLSLVQVTFIGAAFNLIGVLPIKTFGGLGYLEAGLAGILLLLGFEKYLAVSLGILVRLLSFSFVFIMLFIGFLGYKVFFWRENITVAGTGSSRD